MFYFMYYTLYRGARTAFCFPQEARLLDAWDTLGQIGSVGGMGIGRIGIDTGRTMGNHFR